MTEQLAPRVKVRCVFGHIIRARNPPGTTMPCTACDQGGRQGITVTVPQTQAAARAALPPTPDGLAVITRRKTGPAR